MEMMVDQTGKIKIQVGKGVRFFNLPDKALEKIEKDLTFDNQQYVQAKRYGKYLNPNIPPFHKFYAFLNNGKEAWTPRGYIWYMRKWLKQNGYETVIDDRTITLDKIDFQWIGKERDYQLIGINKMMTYPIGVLVAKTGAGKTVMGTMAIARRKQPTLIVVHTKDLMYQWQKAIKTFLGEDCGLVGDGKFEIKNITVAIINTVRNKIDDLRYKFGHVVADECFPAGTLIDGKPIETIRVGDYVNSFNHKTGKIEKKKVTYLFKKKPKTLCTVKLKNGKKITCTENHPFYTDKGYLTASDLNDNSNGGEGNTLWTKGKIRQKEGISFKIERVERVESVTFHQSTSESGFGNLCKDGYVYNIEVEDNHNYFVDNILVHNCHRCPSSVWSEVLIHFPAKYFLGLTATDFRKDGLGKAIFAHIGPRLHKVSDKKLQESGAVLKPQIYKIPTTFRAARCFADEEKLHYSAIIKKLVQDKSRNQLICDTVLNDLKKNRQNILIVSDRVEHCTEIAFMLRKMNVGSRVLSGKLCGSPEVDKVNKKLYIKKMPRKDIVSDVKESKCKVLIATISLIGEGFDAPNLSALFMATPIKFSGRIIQTAGRILRPEKNKLPRVFDFRDENVRVLRYSGFHRDKVYKKEWG